MKRAVFDAKTALLQRRERRTAQSLEANERLDRSALRELQDRRATKLLLHAFRTTDYYRDTFHEAGFTENDLTVAENFVHLPLLTKEQIRDAGAALSSRVVPDRQRLPSRTGGSTGMPLVVYNDDSAPTAAMWWRLYRWWGVHPSDDVAFIYRQARSGVQAAKYALRWWPTRHLLLDARNTTDETIEDFRQQWLRRPPALLVGYVEAVHQFARYVAQSGHKLPAPTAISVTASSLHAGQRRYIEDHLGAPVFDTYRTAEVPWIAAECSAREGLHVQADIRRVDIVTDDGRPCPEGESGSVAVTDLENYAFPLIRYSIGDRGHYLSEPCRCGMSLPRLSPLDGRHADVMHTPSGRIVSGGYGGLFNKWPGLVRQFQIHQAADYSILLRYIPVEGTKGSDSAAQEVAQTLSGFVGGEVPVQVQSVTHIDHIGGKVRLVTSDVEAEAPDA